MALLHKSSVQARIGSTPAQRCLPALPSRPVQSSRSRQAPFSAIQRTPVVVAAASTQARQEARWESQVRDGRVRNISAKDVSAMQAEGWVVLDVRPALEQTKAPIKDSVHVPLFMEDPATDFGAWVKKATDFGMGGWWLGGTHYVSNPNFAGDVQAKLPKDARVIVACQKGLRSLAACEQLARMGYGTIAWINGGLDTARKGDIATTNGQDVRYGGTGGLSEIIGWTEVQREESKEMFGGMGGVIKVFVFILAADAALFAYEQIAYWQRTGTGPFAN